MFDAFRRLLTFLTGILVVVAAALDECPRYAAIAVGLLLMGVFTVPELLLFVKGKIADRTNDTEGGGI